MNRTVAEKYHVAHLSYNQQVDWVATIMKPTCRYIGDCGSDRAGAAQSIRDNW